MLCAEGLCNRNCKSAAQTHTKSKNQKVQRRAGAHRRQRIDAKCLSHDHCICQIVKLLKQISEQQRKCKPDNLFEGVSFCQASFHMLYAPKMQPQKQQLCEAVVRHNRHQIIDRRDQRTGSNCRVHLDLMEEHRDQCADQA